MAEPMRNRATGDRATSAAGEYQSRNERFGDERLSVERRGAERFGGENAGIDVAEIGIETFESDAQRAPATEPSPDSEGLDRGVPADWFVDPIRIGVPGVRQGVDDDSVLLSWQTDALCAQTDPEAFFPEKGGSTRDAKKICSSCEVRSQCLDYALQNDERFGIWGGLSERERRKLRKRVI